MLGDVTDTRADCLGPTGRSAKAVTKPPASASASASAPPSESVRGAGQCRDVRLVRLRPLHPVPGHQRAVAPLPGLPTDVRLLTPGGHARLRRVHGGPDPVPARVRAPVGRDRPAPGAAARSRTGHGGRRVVRPGRGDPVAVRRPDRPGCLHGHLLRRGHRGHGGVRAPGGPGPGGGVRHRLHRRRWGRRPPAGRDPGPVRPVAPDPRLPGRHRGLPARPVRRQPAPGPAVRRPLAAAATAGPGVHPRPVRHRLGQQLPGLGGHRPVPDARPLLRHGAGRDVQPGAGGRGRGPAVGLLGRGAGTRPGSGRPLGPATRARPARRRAGPPRRGRRSALAPAPAGGHRGRRRRPGAGLPGRHGRGQRGGAARPPGRHRVQLLRRDLRRDRRPGDRRGPAGDAHPAARRRRGLRRRAGRALPPRLRPAPRHPGPGRPARLSGPPSGG